MEYTAKTSLHDQNDKHSVRSYLSCNGTPFNSTYIGVKLALSSKSTSKQRPMVYQHLQSPNFFLFCIVLWMEIYPTRHFILCITPLKASPLLAPGHRAFERSAEARIGDVFRKPCQSLLPACIIVEKHRDLLMTSLGYKLGME